jgi:hypothetical protein
MVVNLNFFPCLTGVRQGENLSPFLFSIFLNDLEDFFRQLDGEPLKIIQEKLENELHIFHKIVGFSEMIFKSFANKFNLEFKIEVNNFPTQIISLIARKLSGSDDFLYSCKQA